MGGLKLARVIEAVVQVYESRYHPTTPRAQRFADANWFRDHSGYLPMDNQTRWVQALRVRHDGWLEIDERRYSDEPIQLFPPVSVMYLRIEREQKEE